MRDVVVIGGGPAGLRFATRLAGGGFDVALLDERAQIGRRKICTGIIGAESFEALDLPRSSIVASIQRLKFVSPQGRVLDYTHPELLAHVVDRTRFDQDLARRAAAAGVEIGSGRRVRRLRVSADRAVVEVELIGDPGPARLVEARLVVVATGVNSRLNREVGLGHPTDFLNAAQAHVQVRGLDCTHCFAGRKLAPGAFGWLVPLADGWARVGLMTDSTPSRYLGALLSRISEFLTEGSDQIEADVKPIVQRFVGPSFSDRVIAVGEAAGQVKTTTGGGIYYSLLGADLAAGVAAGALRADRLAAERLSSYERLWRQRIAAEIEAGYLYRKAFSRMTDRQIEALFKLASWNGIIPLVKRTARFDWHLELLTSLARYGPIRSVLEGNRSGTELSSEPS